MQRSNRYRMIEEAAGRTVTDIENMVGGNAYSYPLTDENHPWHQTYMGLKNALSLGEHDACEDMPADTLDRDNIIRTMMTAARFTACDMGGGTMAWRRDTRTGFLLVTDADGGLYGDPEATTWCLGQYLDGQSEPAKVLRNCIALADAIKCAEVWQKD